MRNVLISRLQSKCIQSSGFPGDDASLADHRVFCFFCGVAAGVPLFASADSGAPGALGCSCVRWVAVADRSTIRPGEALESGQAAGPPGRNSGNLCGRGIRYLAWGAEICSRSWMESCYPRSRSGSGPLTEELKNYRRSRLDPWRGSPQTVMTAPIPLLQRLPMDMDCGTCWAMSPTDSVRPPAFATAI